MQEEQCSQINQFQKGSAIQRQFKDVIKLYPVLCSAVQSRVSSAVHYIAMHCKAAIFYTVKFNESSELNCCALKKHIFLKLVGEVHCIAKKCSVIQRIKMQTMALHSIPPPLNQITQKRRRTFVSFFCIGASISIGREIRCLPYAGFFKVTKSKVFSYQNGLLFIIIHGGEQLHPQVLLFNH